VTLPEIIDHFDQTARRNRSGADRLREVPTPETMILAAKWDGHADAFESAARILRAFQEGKP
jgi:hypothetical protein